MEISDDLVCLYSAQIEEHGDRFVIEVPEDEITVGDVVGDAVYRVALIPAGATDTQEKSQKEAHEGPVPPVDEGEQLTVDIEDIGEKGDGIARVERGYVVIVPDTKRGERVTIEITDVRENMGFAEVVAREEYYE